MMVNTIGFVIWKSETLQLCVLLRYTTQKKLSYFDFFNFFGVVFFQYNLPIILVSRLSYLMHSRNKSILDTSRRDGSPCVYIQELSKNSAVFVGSETFCGSQSTNQKSVKLLDLSVTI